MSEENPIEETPTPTEPQNDGGMLARLLWIFTTPRRLYADITADRTGWWEPWVWASVLNMAVAYVGIPIQRRVIELNPNDLPADQLQKTLEAMERPIAKFVGVGSAPLGVLIFGGLFAVISYIAISVLSERSNFRKYFTLFLYSFVVVSVGILLSNIMLRLKGVENIRSFSDLTVSFGPAVLVDPEGSKILFSLLSTLDIFSVWSYLLLGAGAMYVFGLTKKGAILVVVPVWLLWVLVALVGTRMGNFG